ncbi:cytochrome c-type biogenesis protein CcmH [bacterium]|jgi:cytochrome c-type biogenesis protein CcmH|nr:cytochrome c-type biogenesis protein CcmH [Acidimicrobiaceae bacterium]MDA9359935.1 cytochrome c-type biogenesis protein CcmH [bacterium]MDC0349407.1 cytochrome c-type biogenesis protein CcmH [bacterium]MDC3300264.1 cytochrome c-type biogenesis protein CcmH [Acidimicrobiales bacterium]
MARTGFKEQWRWLSWVLMAIVGIAALIVGATADGGPQSDGERMSELASTIRCPQCRGQSVAESNVAIAREIRGDIRNRISAGESDDDIRQVYIDRYGRSIVLNPDSGGFTGLVWIVPVLAAGLATAAIALAFQRWRIEASSVAFASDEDHELVAKLRRERR